MAPWVPRMQVFEVDDQAWFPPFMRAKIQEGLTLTWNSCIPPLQKISPAHMVARTIMAELSDAVRDFVFVDFCSGGGGPTPSIEKYLNEHLQLKDDGGQPLPASQQKPPVHFIMTDLHPHEESWRRAAALSPNIGYEAQPVDASAVPPDLIARCKEGGKKKVFRLFNLAFHHFDDDLARAILKNTVETGDGFGIFELQDRSFASFVMLCLLGVLILVTAPYYIWIWRSPSTFLFTYLIPIYPFVMVFDGWMSSLRARTPDEVDALLRTCGAEPEELSRWEIRSGRDTHMQPVGHMHWMICVRK